MSKPENRYILKIHKDLPKGLYREKMANPYRGGTPDVYYEGNKDILWVEYKYLEKLPPTLTLNNPKGQTKVSPLQERWLRRTSHNGRKAKVILGVGSKQGVIFDTVEIDKTFTREMLEQRLMPNEAIVEYITQQTMKKS